MPRWMRIARGMIGTGLTFAAGVGAVGGIVGGIAWLAGAGPAFGIFGMVGRFSIVAGILGTFFSGALALIARGVSFEKLSLRLVSALGAGGGLLFFLLIGFNSGFRAWNARDAIANFVLLLAMGAGAAAGTLLVARKAKRALGAGEDVPSLGEGAAENLSAKTHADATPESRYRV